jgi:membrane protein DedA with SNARE-associated domain
MVSTGVPVVDWFLALLDSWGYLIVFGFTVFENLFVVGSFTPGETVVIAAALVASNKGLAIAGVWIASVLGTVVGSNVSFFLGRRAGLGSVRDFIERVAATRTGRFFRVNVDGFEDVQDHFDEHGSKTVLLSRFAIGAKNFVPAVAGAVRMPVFWFEFYTVVGAIIYTSIMCAIGWFLGENMDQALRVARNVGIAGLLLFSLFVVAAVVAGRQIRARRKAARTQVAVEGEPVAEPMDADSETSETSETDDTA